MTPKTSKNWCAINALGVRDPHQVSPLPRGSFRWSGASATDILNDICCNHYVWKQICSNNVRTPVITTNSCCYNYSHHNKSRLKKSHGNMLEVSGPFHTFHCTINFSQLANGFIRSSFTGAKTFCQLPLPLVAVLSSWSLSKTLPIEQHWLDTDAGKQLS